MTGTFHILITGAGGQLGCALTRSHWPSTIRVTALDRRELDIRSTGQVDIVLATGRFDAVVNAAAYTNVDRAEREFDEAFATNADAAANLAAACDRHAAVLIHPSTDYVFDGTKAAPYTESDPINPLNAYGRTKAAGEFEVGARAARYIILRTAWLFSAEQNNFVRKILDLALKRDEISVVADQTGNPTSAADLAQVVVEVVDHLFAKGEAFTDRRIWGVYHCVNSGAATWYDLASESIDIASTYWPRRPRVRRIATADYPTAAARPANSQLDCGKLESAFGIRLRPWREALRPVVNEMFEETCT